LSREKILDETFQISTARLILLSADGVLLRADAAGPDALAAAAPATVPANWPPEHHDQGVIEWVLRTLERSPPVDPWHFYYLLLREPRTLLGTCGVKGAPDAHGCVEVGYSVLEQFRGQGFATEAVLALMEVAFAAGAAEVAAETYPALLPSLRVMQKCGMTVRGAGADAGTIRYSRRRPTPL
jgi:ribosomal-protein-alanine N-acetyltransferase